ncbi:hypothetical protein [Paenibacillus sp. DYY-L-2]|uniref:hypothetical protein n=1 Tax=Paenibacillus sp. DYY-L-2 TaxID=3447013 RepID=UPI003F4FA189
MFLRAFKSAYLPKMKNRRTCRRLSRIFFADDRIHDFHNTNLPREKSNEWTRGGKIADKNRNACSYLKSNNIRQFLNLLEWQGVYTEKNGIGGTRLKRLFFASIISVILLSGCVNQQMLNLDNRITGEPAETDFSKSDTAPKPSLLLSETPDKKVAIYGNEGTQSDIFKTLTIHFDGEAKDYDWINVTNPSFYPQIFLVDLNADGEKEIAVVLTTGSGTGIFESEVHILTHHFAEIPIDDPREFVMKKLKVDVVTDHEIRKYEASYDGRKYSNVFQDNDTSEWFEVPTVKNILRFGIQNDKLIADLPVQIGMGVFLGVATVKYEFTDGKLKPSELDITKDGSL